MSLPTSIGSLGAPSAFLLQNCERCIDREKDGNLLGSWLLTFINHSGAQQDRIVLLTERSLFRANVNFERGTVNHATRLPLEHVESISIGQLTLSTRSAERMGRLLGGSSKAAGKSKVTAIRVVMSSAFVEATEPSTTRSGWLGRLIPPDKAGLSQSLFVSKADPGEAEPASGPKSVPSLATALKAALGNLPAGQQRRDRLREEDVLLPLNAADVAFAAARNDVAHFFDLRRRPAGPPVLVGGVTET